MRASLAGLRESMLVAQRAAADLWDELQGTPILLAPGVRERYQRVAAEARRAEARYQEALALGDSYPLARLDADAATMTGDTRAANDRARDILSIPRAPVDDSYPLDEVRVPGARLPSPAFDAEEPEVYGLPVSHPWQPLEVQEGARVARERQRAAGQQRPEDASRSLLAEAPAQHVRQQRAHRRRGPSPLTSARGRQLLAREITRDIFERFVGALKGA